MASDTKQRILDAAEQQFGDRGFAETSLRDITQKAHVNLAAVNYHFGSKEALLAAVLERRLQPINERRLQILDDLELRAGSEGPPLVEIVRAFVSPPFEKQQEWGDTGQRFLRVLGRVHGETNDDFREVFMSEFDLVYQRFATALSRALPHLENADLTWRMLFMIGSMAFTMSWGQSIVKRDPTATRSPNEIINALVAFASAGLEAQQPLAIPVETRGREVQ